MTTKIAIYLSPDADSKTRERFFEAVEQINDMLKTGDIGAVQRWDVQSSVVWMLVNQSEHMHIVSCKNIARLILERNRIGDKYEIAVNPNSI